MAQRVDSFLKHVRSTSASIHFRSKFGTEMRRRGRKADARALSVSTPTTAVNIIYDSRPPRAHASRPWSAFLIRVCGRVRPFASKTLPRPHLATPLFPRRRPNSHGQRRQPRRLCPCDAFRGGRLLAGQEGNAPGARARPCVATPGFVQNTLVVYPRAAPRGGRLPS